jgi:hypothetical protein
MRFDSDEFAPEFAEKRVALHGNVAHPDAGGVVDRDGHRGGGADDADLAGAT